MQKHETIKSLIYIHVYHHCSSLLILPSVQVYLSLSLYLLSHLHYLTIQQRKIKSCLYFVHIQFKCLFTCRQHESVLPVCVCVGVQLSHTALGNEPPLSWGRKQIFVAGITDARSPTSTQMNRLMYRHISDIIRKSKNGILLYWSHSEITHIQLHIGLLNCDKYISNSIKPVLHVSGCVFDLIMNYSALANQTKPCVLSSCEQLWWVSVFGGQVTMGTGTAIGMVTKLSSSLVLLGSPDVICN